MWNTLIVKKKIIKTRDLFNKYQNQTRMKITLNVIWLYLKSISKVITIQKFLVSFQFMFLESWHGHSPNNVHSDVS